MWCRTGPPRRRALRQARKCLWQHQKVWVEAVCVSSQAFEVGSLARSAQSGFDAE